MPEPILIYVVVALVLGLVSGLLIAGTRNRAELNREVERRSAAEARIPALSERCEELEQELEATEKQVRSLEIQATEQQAALAHHRARLEEKEKGLAEVERAFSDSFKALSSEALEKNNELFLKLAQQKFANIEERSQSELDKRKESINQLVKPLQESLLKVDNKLGELEKARAEQFGSLSEHLKLVAEGQINLKKETEQLVHALRTPHVRGRWGEIHLRRVVELAGMVDYCDFSEQSSTSTESGRLRPDLVVHLPNDKTIVVDAKASLKQYLDGIEASSKTEQEKFFARHALTIRDHVKQLSKKEYWQAFGETAEFVVLFLPGEQFFSEALKHDRELIEFGVERRVILATPTTLIALLKAVAYGWRQEQMTKNSKLVAELGRELYDRIAILAEHFTDLKRGLERANESYNRAVGTLERRVITTARKFQELEVSSSKPLAESTEIEVAPRKLTAPEFELESQATKS